MSTFPHPHEYITGISSRSARRQCVALMPSGFHDVFQAVADACKAKEIGVAYLRPEDSARSEMVMARVLEDISQSQFVVADLTGKNANVFYELGVAHCFRPAREVIIITQNEADVPFDVAHIRHIVYERTHAGLGKLTGDLKLSLSAALQARTVSASQRGHWQELKELINSANSLEKQGTALKKIVSLLADWAASREPILRLWGSQRSMPDRQTFDALGRLVGEACATANASVSGSALNPDTLEYWALRGIESAASTQSARRWHAYLHFTDEHSVYADAALDLRRTLKDHLVEIRYPHYDARQRAVLNEDVSYDPSPAHDARLGSLLQCDAVVLLGGASSAQHLVQLLRFIGKHRVRAAKPIHFVPLPWAGGTGRRVYDTFSGVVEELDPELLVDA